MALEVQFFGQLTDKIGKSTVQLNHATNLIQLKEILFKEFPLLKESKFVIAINNKMATDTSEIPEHAVIALMPPFSGG